jgi:TonB family protein
MKNIFITIYCLLSIGKILGQSVEYYEFSDKAIKLIEAKDYLQGIILLDKVIQEYPNPDAYFNRAAAHLYLGDTCNFCADLEKTIEESYNNDDDAKQLYFKKCRLMSISETIPDSLKAQYPDIKYIKTIVSKCNTEFPAKYIYKDQNNVSLNRVTEEYTSDIFESVPEIPTFPGGRDSLDVYLERKLIYPKLAKQYGIEGTVLVRFVVNQNGEISNVKVLRGIGAGCDEETVRIIRLMPKWNPGRQNGNTVRVYYNLPVRFGINNKKKSKH